MKTDTPQASFIVTSVNVSEEKGVPKKPVPSISLTQTGVEGDAHVGRWHRQVSLLAEESIHRFESQSGLKLSPGAFAENITTQGFTLHSARPLDRFVSNNTELEVTQIGKTCHGSGCSIYNQTSACIMPTEGIFCRVLKGGIVSPGDRFMYRPHIFRVLLITLSDRASTGLYSDNSGPVIRQHLEEVFNKMGYKYLIDYQIIPDEAARLSNLLAQARTSIDLIVTTGGTGIGSRDITPEVIRGIIDKEIPGIMDFIRQKYGQTNPNALISRSLSGIKDQCLVFALPGSVKAVTEYMTEISRLLPHLFFMAHDLNTH